MRHPRDRALAGRYRGMESGVCHGSAMTGISQPTQWHDSLEMSRCARHDTPVMSFLQHEAVMASLSSGEQRYLDRLDTRESFHNRSPVRAAGGAEVDPGRLQHVGGHPLTQHVAQNLIGQVQQLYYDGQITMRCR